MTLTAPPSRPHEVATAPVEPGDRAGGGRGQHPYPDLRRRPEPPSGAYVVAVTVTLLLFTLVFLFPLYWMVTGALKTPVEFAQTHADPHPAESFHPETYVDAWTNLRIGKYFLNTVYYALGGWLIQLIVDVAAAYALSKLRPMLRQGGARRDAGQPDAAGRGAAGAGLPDRRRRADLRREPAQHPVGAVAAGRGQRVQHLRAQAVLRPDPATTCSTRRRIDGAGRLRMLWSDRAAAVAAGARRGLDLRDHRRSGRTSSGRCWCCRTRRCRPSAWR